MATDSNQGGLHAPEDERAVIVLANGVTVSLRLRLSEKYHVSRSITEGTLETGYKISDGEVDNAPEVEIEGIITGSDIITQPNNMERAASEAASLKNAYDQKEFASVYLTFVAIADARISDLTIEARPKQKYYTVSMTAQQVKTVSFKRTQSTGTAPAAKTKSDAGKNKTNTGKKSATPATLGGLMEKDVFKIDLLASVPDQDFSISLGGEVFNMRVFFSTGPRLWWLELSNLDRSVTLSQIVLRPGVIIGLSGRFPGYQGEAAIGMVRIMPGAEYGSIEAFSGGFGLFFIDNTQQ